MKGDKPGYFMRWVRMLAGTNRRPSAYETFELLRRMDHTLEELDKVAKIVEEQYRITLEEKRIFSIIEVTVDPAEVLEWQEKLRKLRK